MSTSRVIEVSAGVLIDGGRVLLGQRPPGTRHAGRWEFPGGKVEPGETLAESLRRELHEELAIDAEIGPPVWHTVHRYAEGPAIAITFFRIAAYRGTPSNQHYQRLQWLTPAEVTGVDVLDADRAFVTALARGEVSVDSGPGALP